MPAPRVEISVIIADPPRYGMEDLLFNSLDKGGDNVLQYSDVYFLDRERQRFLAKEMSRKKAQQRNNRKMEHKRRAKRSLQSGTYNPGGEGRWYL